MAGIDDELEIHKGGHGSATAVVQGPAGTSAADPSPATQAAEPSADLGETDPTVTPSDGEIAEALASGTMSPEQARTRLLEEALERQLPEGVGEAEAARMRANLEQLLANDPMIDDLLGPA